MKNIYLRSILFLSYFGLLILCGGCEVFDFSPDEVILHHSERNLNQKNAEKIASLNIQPTDTLRFALIADTQRFYDETEDFVTAVNERTKQKGKRIHFTLLAGDITDFGLLDEYRWIHNILKKLDMPYMTVIGNHDCVGNGKKVYSAMYGPYDHTLQVARNRFVFLNTNYLEFDAKTPHLDFLENSLKTDSANYDNAFVIAHIGPFDNDANKAKEMAYAKLIADYKVRYSIHGHRHDHKFERPYDDQKGYLTVGSTNYRSYVVVTVIGKKFSYELIKY